MSEKTDRGGPGGTDVDPRRALPAVDRLLSRPPVRSWMAAWGRESVRDALRETLEEARAAAAGGGEAPEERDLLARTEQRLRLRFRPSLRPLLNGTGVVLHTNLGRAPLAGVAIEAVARVARGYTNLEYEVEEGRRGSRHQHCARLLTELTGSEAALVVNNNAAAVALTVNELARGREVLISRGELVEIGGSFRIPEVVKRAGARLREVGTTNRTRAQDYREAIGPRTAAILKVHPSNYALSGYVASVELEELVGIGRAAGIPVIHDLGSGLLRPELLPGFPREPSPGGSVAAGADVVCWSGDKLLGGPQAGIVHGTAETISRLRGNPLLRAFRVDRMTLAALEATLLAYRDPETAVRLPVLAMLRESADSVERRARAALVGAPPEVAEGLRVRRMASVVGGGAYPDFEIASAGWTVAREPERVDRACRTGEPPLIGRLEEGEYRVDVRTLLPGQEEEALRVLVAALRRVVGGGA